VNSWASPACYPRGSFYPLIHGPSTRNRGVTRPGFRPCSACQPRSQAPLCPCTQRRVSIPPEGTFGRLRYLLGGCRPSKTGNQALSAARVHGSALGPRFDQGGISPAAPPELAPGLLSLPPILHRPNPNPIPGSSKAPRGLFCPAAGTARLHAVRSFAGTLLGTAPRSLRLSCGSELRLLPVFPLEADYPFTSPEHP
jgi:hypothetical protein